MGQRFGGWLRGLGFRLRQGKYQRELRDEMREHVRLKAQELTAGGMAEPEAMSAAQKTFGNELKLREESQDSWHWNWLAALIQDLLYGLRQIRRNPGYAAIVTATLAIGIGANTAIFSLMNAVAYQHLPVPRPHQLVYFNWSARHSIRTHSTYFYDECQSSANGTSGCSFTFPLYRQILHDTKDFQSAFAYSGIYPLHILNGQNLTSEQGRFCTSQFFAGLQVRPYLGRFFDSADDRAGATPVAVLAYGYWRAAFHGDKQILGHAIRVGSVPAIVIGIAPPGFHGLVIGEREELWMPTADAGRILNVSQQHRALMRNNGSAWLELAARLRPGISLAQARTAADAALRFQMRHSAHPIFHPRDQPKITLATMAGGLPRVSKILLPLFDLLIASAGLVLLIICVNLSGLGLTRAQQRQREMAIRLSVGASRRRVLRQLFTESLLLALLGAGLGIAFAYASSGLLIRFLSRNWGHHLALNFSLNLPVLLFTLAIAIFAALASGLIPALHATRVELYARLKQMREDAPGKHKARTGNVLAVIQTALALVIMGGAGLLLRTLYKLETRPVGFSEHRLITITASFPHATASAAPGWQRMENLRQRIEHFSGVKSASIADMPLLNEESSTQDVHLHPGKPAIGWAYALWVGPRYFSTMGIPILSGRKFAPADFGPMSPQPKSPAIIVNHAFARQYFPGKNALGRLVWVGRKKSFQIAGVAGNTLFQSLRGKIKPIVYYPTYLSNGVMLVRTAMASAGLMPSLWRSMHKFDPDVPFGQPQSQIQIIEKSLFQQRLMGILLSLFAGIVMALACLGLYGLLAFETLQQRREIGIRMALGAQAAQVRRGVLARGLKLSGFGVAAGLILALGVNRFLSSQLYGISPMDFWALFSASLLLLGVAALACWLPARRSTHIDPWQTLRYE